MDIKNDLHESAVADVADAIAITDFLHQISETVSHEQDGRLVFCGPHSLEALKATIGRVAEGVDLSNDDQFVAYMTGLKDFWLYMLTFGSDAVAETAEALAAQAVNEMIDNLRRGTL